MLLTDVVLKTGINGIDLAQAAREARPGLPVIFMSGYTAVPEAQQRIRDTGAPLLSKPFTTPQLERAVKAVCASLADCLAVASGPRRQAIGKVRKERVRRDAHQGVERYGQHRAFASRAERAQVHDVG